MDEKKSDDQNTLKSSKFTEEYLQKASYLGTILPLLDIVYETLIEKWIKKYDLNIVKEFWIFFGLFVFTLVYYFFGVRIETVIFLGFATIFTLIVYNFDFFKKRIIPDDNEEIQLFIIDIENKTFIEVINFIKQYRKKLKDPEIKKIINSSKGRIGTTYNFLLNYQPISSDLLIYIIETDRFDVMGEDLFISYLRRFVSGMNYDNYLFLVSHFNRNKRILKIINLYNPNYSKKKSSFNSIAKLVQSFNISLKKGKISEIITFLSFLLVSVAAITGYNQISHPYLKIEPYLSFPIFFFINYLFAIILTSMILIIVVTIFFDTLSKIFWFILEFFSPDEIQN